MKPIKIKLVKLYLWTGLGYFLLGVLGIAGFFPGNFFLVVLNNLWAIIYVIPLNYVLFEYTLPFVFSRNRSFVYKILAGRRQRSGCPG